MHNVSKFVIAYKNKIRYHRKTEIIFIVYNIPTLIKPLYGFIISIRKAMVSHIQCPKMLNNNK